MSRTTAPSALLINDSVILTSVTDIADMLESLQLARLVCSQILSLVLGVFGLITNSINVIVLTRRWMHSSTNYYLTALSICDMLYLIFYYWVTLKLYQYTQQNSFYMHSLPIFMPLANNTSNCATFLICTFSIERYIVVCHPMKGRRICTKERARWVILAVFVIATILTLPDYLEWTTTTEYTYSSQGNSTVYKLKPALTAKLFSKIGYYYIGQILFYFFPLLLLFMFNSLLTASVYRASQQRQRMTSNYFGPKKARNIGEQQRITLMLIIVVLVFTIFQLPSTVSRIINSLYLSGHIAKSDIFEIKLLILGNVANVFVQLNTVCNFLLYSAFSMKFRTTFKQIFCHCSLRRSDESHDKGVLTHLVHRRAVRSRNDTHSGARCPVKTDTIDDCPANVQRSNGESGNEAYHYMLPGTGLSIT